jgi:hypothetical protein
MFENPTTSAHKEHVRFYSTELWRRIDSTALFKVPAPAPSAALVPASAHSAATDWVWEETTHFAYRVGEKVEVVNVFKPKYKDFIGSDAVIRKIVAKKIAPDKYRDYIFFVEVEGRDAIETEKFRSAIRMLNNKCFTDILDGNSRSLLPCRMSHICCVSRLRREMAAAASAAAAAKRTHDDKDAQDDASKKPRLEQDPPALDEIKLGDRVEILKTLYIMKEFVGYHGVVRKMAKRESFTSCWIEITHNSTGLPVPPFLTEDVRRKNANFYSEPELWVSWVCCRVENIVLAEPGLPDPFTGEAWAALSVRDRKMHRQRLQKENAAKKDLDRDSTAPPPKDINAKPVSKLDMLFDAALAELDRLEKPPRDIAVGDSVRISRIVYKDWYPADFVGFYGVVRSIQKGIQKNPVHTECFVELTHDRAGAPVTPQHTSTVEDWNKGMYDSKDKAFMKCNLEYIALADPKVPRPASQDPTRHERAGQASSSKLHRDRVRHRKYNPVARAPWRGGEVRPYLYGRRVVFILGGERGESITR